MDVAEELDTGVVRCRAATPIGSDESADELRKRLAGLGSTLLVDALARGSAKATTGGRTHVGPQDRARGPPSTGPGPPRNSIGCRVGGAHTTFRGEPFKVWQATPCGSPGAGAGNSSVTWWPSAPSTDRLRGRPAASG
ncbi:MAG: hypothetical protein Ct9H300mP12_04040 [Acidimicrobiales bacterium]|nr:MAG: hypothetical protein Ct9H300mP12_04040 [Acidimicrobiales bacterium]